MRHSHQQLPLATTLLSSLLQPGLIAVSGEQITACGLNINANVPASSWAGCYGTTANTAGASLSTCQPPPPGFDASSWEWVCTDKPTNGKKYVGVWCIFNHFCCAHTVGWMTPNGQDWTWSPCS